MLPLTLFYYIRTIENIYNIYWSVSHRMIILHPWQHLPKAFVLSRLFMFLLKNSRLTVPFFSVGGLFSTSITFVLFQARNLPLSLFFLKKKYCIFFAILLFRDLFKRQIQLLCPSVKFSYVQHVWFPTLLEYMCLCFSLMLIILSITSSDISSPSLLSSSAGQFHR